ncbi:MAG: ATP-dependent DNA helicase RecG [Oscillospiraceae bacterium]|nr:ATP-dependent DNA helicase RecG [Oscillospiraceae bacterium]
MENKSLETSVRFLKGVGQAREKFMSKLGIETLRDLVSFFPRAYEDRTQFKKTNSLIIGETVCVRAMAAATPQLSHIRKGLDIVKLRAVDEVGALELTFFNQSFVKDAIKPGETYIFYGKVEGSLTRPAMINPLFDRDDARQEHGSFISAKEGMDAPTNSTKTAVTGRIMPIYPLTAGLSQKIVFTAVRNALDQCGDELPDVLPVSVARKYELCKVRYAYENIHCPDDYKALEIARKRLIFEELFVLIAAMKLLREGRSEKTGRSLTQPNWKEFFGALTFTPTNAQKRAIDEAARDMVSDSVMNRLIQGDVGSGKTLVAAACCFMTCRSGCQAAFMAPTEILARQHYVSLVQLLEPMGIRIGFLTGSLTAKQKRDVYGKLSLGEIDLIIGTHALISESVNFRDLALVITDEQHRFGVNQRSMLTEKGDSPHVLVMSATPIPRTLALIIYGDLDVSVIDELPPGRQTIETYVVGEQHRKRIYDFVRKLVGAGRQVYIICPMVEEREAQQEGSSVVFAKEGGVTPTSTGNNPTSLLKSAREYYEELKKDIFPDLRVALVHGKMPTKEKDAAMSAFTNGAADVLVATTVVEVGVDVSNAALIIIENADRFGLSQLHQLRGRVGRGEFESYCVLFRGAGSENSRERLEIMRTTNDGFKIAEEDLKQRGPGDFFGSRQHGLPDMKIANLASDMFVLQQAQKAADEVLSLDPMLEAVENRPLARQISRVFEINADRLN